MKAKSFWKFTYQSVSYNDPSIKKHDKSPRIKRKLYIDEDILKYEFFYLYRWK
jgi:hypothetical protein